MDIQTAGQQILNKQPTKFYVFCGLEFGIKERYLNILKEHYGEMVEYDRVQELFSLFGRKQLMPLQPKLYVVRYDEDFIASMDGTAADTVKKLNIIGTVVCIYQSSKHCTKCSKHLAEFTVSFDTVNSVYIKKYLTADFPNLGSNLIDFAVQIHSDYKAAWNVCSCLNMADSNLVKQYSSKVLADLFGHRDITSSEQLKIGIAAKNFGYSLSVIESYSEDLSGVFYVILNTLIELEKLTATPHASSALKDYAKIWNISDVYHMFMNTYAELEKSRKLSAYDICSGAVYLLGLMQFQSIPPVNSF